ncbi:MAG: sensor histidine kinase [Solirubrobacteraceae bacterium]
MSIEQPGVVLDRPGVAWRSVRWPRRLLDLLARRRREYALAIVALVSAGAALWITLRADFLAYPGWLAVQKADFILGPIAVGLYWRLRRPNSRLGSLLIVLGLCGVPYVLESTTVPALFAVGLIAESAIYLMTSVVILAFPSGRLDGRAEQLIIALVVIAVILPTPFLAVAVPHIGPSFSISGCRGDCPANGLAIWSSPSWLPQLLDVQGVLLVAIPLATAGVLVSRFVSGTTPRRRALAVGGPIALLFVLVQAAYRALFLFAPNGLDPTAKPVQSALQWTFAGARAAIWYGFLLALVAAELYAGRTLRRLLRQSLGQPSFGELEQMLRTELGDPELRLGFFRRHSRDWAGSDDAPLSPPGRGQRFTTVDHSGQPAVAIVHDAQLAEDPELLHAAGAAALLAVENAELEAAWKQSLRALADSNARVTKASDAERQKLERDLHDGAQQRLLATLLRLSSAGELAEHNPELKEEVVAATNELEEAINELREIAHGIYPTVLSDLGLPAALADISRRSTIPLTIAESTDRRFSPEIEAAFYYCCLETIQNTAKHAGPNATASIRLSADVHELRLEVQDDGPGFDTARQHDGLGLQNMRDRIGAVGGQVTVTSAPGHGTLVIATAPNR